MAISSDHVIKEVSKKLKYYFDVKRLEDGFDLSGVACPRLDHPPTKARPTLLYDGLHDRPLKHYFSPQQVKATLTQFKQPKGKNNREKEVRRQLERYFRRYQFAENSTKRDTRSGNTSGPTVGPPNSTTDFQHKKPRSAKSAKSRKGHAQPSVLADEYYTSKKGSKKLKPEASGGFGTGLKKRKGAFNGGQPVLRSVPPTGTSRHETDRLVNIASRLLVATETIDLKYLPTGKYQSQSKKEESRGAPQSFESGSRGRQFVYTYDINGRKVLLQKKEPPESPSRSPTPTGNYVTITGETANDNVMPRWIQKELSRNENANQESNRPQSAQEPSSPKLLEEHRPHSAAVLRRTPRTSSESEPTQSAQTKRGWENHSASGDDCHGYESGTTAMAVQTGPELLRNYEPDDFVLTEGERREYEVRVFTGNRLGASTKADIRVLLIGDRGRTQHILLQNSSTHKIKFQKGQEDVFKFDTFYVGPLRKIGIGHDRHELGYGWYLQRVEVRDVTQQILYSISCDRWLSSQEKQTFRELKVDYSTTFTPENPERREPQNAPSSEPEDVDVHSARSTDTHSDKSSTRTSVATIYSDGSDRSSSRKEHKRTQRRASYTSRSSYSSSTASSASSSRSSSPRRPTEDAKEEKDEEKAKPLPPLKPLQRRDTFFDQQTAGPDFTSVIDSLSTTTEERRNSADFERIKPIYEARDPTGKPLSLIQDEDTGQLEEDDVSNKPADQREEEQTGTGLSILQPAPPQQPKAMGDVYFDGFKAGVQAAQNTKAAAKDESDKESEKEDIDQGPTIHEAAKNGDLARLKKIIEKNSASKDSVDERGWAPIHSAAAIGNTEIIKWLAVTNADLNMETPTSYTAMHLAAMHGHTNTMIVLYAMGAKLTSKSVDHQTPLHVAAKGGHIETVKWLVANRAPLDTFDNMGRTALDLAEEHHHEDTAEFLSSCKREQERPGSGLSLIRSNSKQSLSDKDDGKKSYTSYSTDTNYSTDSDTDDPGWRDDYNYRPTTSMGRRASDGQSDRTTDSKTDPKHDEELMEKRQIYDEQQRRMSEKNVSFLDAIRDEVG